MKVQRQTANRQKPWWDENTNTKKEETNKGPLVLVTHGAKGTRISALGPDGLAEGLWTDMKLNDARAMLPDLQVRNHDVVADRLLHNRLGLWMLRYSPSVALQGEDGFVLNITGCAHLFGGEVAMAHDIQSRFSAMGFTCRLAFADTVGAALALVSYGADDVHILPRQHNPNSLDNLPVEALRLNDETVTLLKRLGLKLIGDVRCLPRSALERRFRASKKSETKTKITGLTQAVQWRLDQLTGSITEPLDYITEPQAFRATKQCPALALETGAVEIALDELLPSLCEQLRTAGMSARRFRLTGYRADGGMSSVSARLSAPANKPENIKRLFKDKYERIDCGFGIDLFVLEGLLVSPVSEVQPDMEAPDNAALATSSLAGFADVVTNQSAQDSVVRLVPNESYVPERAQRQAPVNIIADWDAWKSVQPNWALRPLRLFIRPEPAQVTAELPDSPPMQFVWRKRLRKVVRSRGPERILPEWWKDNFKTKRSAAFRDYYDVEDADGLRYWLFRSIKDEPTEDGDEMVRTINWFVHGLF
ncbi:hypothetical protein SU32_15000 [Ahrensia marina]|uniref:UmuC domain-containing protein n=1 Tax=Ahrensia marina TaxID=1514904 RepID=A0A0M9GL18_9HYPH|nr:hypothetical protein SU32_15000 [Ahrensia marina]